MTAASAQQRIRTFCALCIARCGAVAVVEDGRFVAPRTRPAHPTGQALCAKGRAAPELVYHPRAADASAPPHPPERRSRSRLGANRLGRGARPDRRRDAPRRRTARPASRRVHHVLALDHRDRRFHRLHPAAGERVRHAELGDHPRPLRLGPRLRHPLHLWRRQRRHAAAAAARCRISPTPAV